MLALAALFGLSCGAALLGHLWDRALAFCLRAPSPRLDRLSLLLSLLGGSLLLATARAAYDTQGKSLLLLLFVACSALRGALLRAPLASAEPLRPRAALLFVGAALLGLFALQHASLYHGTSAQLQPLYIDEFYYTKSSFRISETGAENNLSASLYWDESLRGTSPYHYFDLWLQAAIARSTGLSWLEARVLVVVPFCWLLGLLGFWELAAASRGAARSALWAGLGFFVCGLSLLPDSGLGGYFAKLQGLAYAAPSAPKLAFLYPWIVAAYLMARRGAFRHAAFFALSLPLVAISTLPMILGGVGLFALLRWLRGWRRDEFALGFSAALVLLSVFGFYALSGEPVEGLLRYVLQEGSGAWGRVKPVFLYGVQRALLLAPWLGLWLWLRRAWPRRAFSAEERAGLWLAASLFLCGLLVWIAFSPFYDAHQFFDNIEIVLVHTALFDLWQHGISATPGRFGRAAWLLLGLLSIGKTGQSLVSRWTEAPQHSAEYEETVQAISAHFPPGTLGGSWQNLATRNTQGGHFPESELLGGFVLARAPWVQPVNLGIPEMVEQFYERDANFRALIEQSAMFRDLSAQGETTLPKEEQRWRFAARRRLRYLFLAPGTVLSPRLQARVRREVVDSQTGERFLLLSWEKDPTSPPTP